MTGAASGIGLAAAELLAANGARLVLADYESGAAEEQSRQLVDKGAEALAYGLDVSHAEEVASLFDFTREHFGPVQILVNSAGITGPNMPAVEISYEEWQRTLDVNLTGTFLCSQAALKHMLEIQYGRIVNIASIAGKEGNPQLAAYSASKGAVIALTKALAKEVAQSGIYVNCIAPAVINTPILAQISQEHIDYMLSKIPRARFVKVEEIAALAAWCASQDNSFTTGAVFDISGGRATY